MRRVILFVSVLTLFLSGCNYPSDSDALSAESPLPPTGEPSPPSAPAATNTLVHTPTTAPTLEATEPPPPPTDTVSDLRMLPLTPGDEFILTQISMINQSTGWGIGHQIGSDDHILRTKDGGQTWFDLTPPETPPQQGEPKKIAWGYFADAENAWVIYAYEKWSVIPPAPRVWKTADGGASWQASQELSLTGQEDSFLPEGFTFSNNEHGWLLIHIGGGMHHDYSLLFGTGDGGQTWQRLVDPYKPGLQSLGNTGLVFVDEKTGWVSKDNMGVMFGAFWEETIDGGRNWESHFLPAPPELDWKNDPSACRTESPHFTSAQTAAIIVNCHTFGDSESQDLTYIYVTGDRGQSWQHTKLPSPVNKLDFINYQTGWATGRDIYMTTDGGLSWVKIKTVNWDGQFSFVDAQTGWAVAVKNDTAALVKTDDSGRTWELILPLIGEE
ncbi:MAG: hypothetical protein B5M51_05110 [Anaerolinea sp. 4484_236]|nr:MAG: hypothetical protein B5M51_05110 [Anaerolinea sp. 4484_236]RLD05791.1 MAG: hypothetical protein DRI56_08890 [Chloroflexota bacterium]